MFVVQDPWIVYKVSKHVTDIHGLVTCSNHAETRDKLQRQHRANDERLVRGIGLRCHHLDDHASSSTMMRLNDS